MSHLLVQSDARHIPLPDGSAHCVVTSPPYFGLRDYGTATWEGGDPACDHQEIRPQNRPGRETPGGRGGTFPSSERAYRDACGKCGARRIDRQIGLEPSPAEFVACMVRVFREVWRVLHPMGTCWINLGDSFSSGGRTSQCEPSVGVVRHPGMRNGAGARPPVCPGLKSKDMIGIPWRVALALQADGWWLRSDIIWAKSNPMPESATDRPTKSHEYMFLMAKSERYYFDGEAVKEAIQSGPSDIRKMEQGMDRIGGKNKTLVDPFSKASSTTNIGQKRSVGDPSGRNIRTVWSIPTESYPGAHFATYPRKLVEPCVKAGTSQRGCCPECAPWEREMERGESDYVRLGRHVGEDFGINDSVPGSSGQTRTRNGTVPSSKRATSRDLGWHPTCTHNLDPVPCVVLDPFCGSATTGVVAEALGRRFVGLDLSRDYLVGQAQRRLTRPHAAPIRPDRGAPMPLFAGLEELA